MCCFDPSPSPHSGGAQSPAINSPSGALQPQLGPTLRRGAATRARRAEGLATGPARHTTALLDRAVTCILLFVEGLGEGAGVGMGNGAAGGQKLNAQSNR